MLMTAEPQGLINNTNFVSLLGASYFQCALPGWRNGRRYGLKIRCPKGRAGSTPALGTIPNLPVELRTFDY